jgi:hypothetical protein
VPLVFVLDPVELLGADPPVGVGPGLAALLAARAAPVPVRLTVTFAVTLRLPLVIMTPTAANDDKMPCDRCGGAA